MKPEWVAVALQLGLLVCGVVSVYAVLKYKVNDLVESFADLKGQNDKQDVHIADIKTTVDHLTTKIEYLEKQAEADQKTRHELRDMIHNLSMNVSEVKTTMNLLLRFADKILAEKKDA